MRSIHITDDHGDVKIVIDGAELTRLHSLSIDYLRGAPLLLSIVADVGGEKKTEHRILQ